MPPQKQKPVSEERLKGLEARVLKLERSLEMLLKELEARKKFFKP